MVSQYKRADDVIGLRDPVEHHVGDQLVAGEARVSGSPSQSLQVRNFSTIHASSPAGESLSAMPSVCGLVPCNCAYAASSRWKRRHRGEIGLLLVGERRPDPSGGRGDRHVEVERRAVLGIERRDPGRDLRAPVAALRAVARVAERDAISSTNACAIRRTSQPGRARGSENAVARAARARSRGTRRRPDRRAASGSVSRGMTSRNSTIEPGQPWMRSSGSASGVLGTRVDEVDRLAVDAGAEVLELVEPRLLGAPVVLVAPVLDQLAQVGDRRSVLPARAVDLRREAGSVDSRSRRSSRVESSTRMRNRSMASGTGETIRRSR